MAEEKKVWFKVLKSGKAMNGRNFDFSDYLPNGKKASEWTPIIPVSELKECSNGYHVTEYWNMWLSENPKEDQIFEVEVKDLAVQSETVGVIEKRVCSSIRFVKEFKPVFDSKTNTGDSNTGYRNTGNCNTGNWNTANNHAGAFNSKEPKFVFLFNKKIPFNKYQKIVWPTWFFFEIETNDQDLKKSWLKAFEKAESKEVKKAVELPNFTFKVFEEITGITKKQILKKINKKKEK